MYDKYNILAFIRDEMVKDPNISDEVAWKAFHIAMDNGDVEALLDRYMLHTSDREKHLCYRAIEDIVRSFT